MNSEIESFSEKYRALSPAEFFMKYKEIAGFNNPTRAMYQTIRELVENALDATDSYGILPIIKIIIQNLSEERKFYKITVEDNGIGLAPHVVPDAFGKLLFSSKYILRQTRGMYGLGVKVAVLYAQMTTGRPVEVTTSKPGLKFIYHFKLRINVNKNEPEVIERSTIRKNVDWNGTIVSLTIHGDWSRAKSKILEYIEKTAVVTPYASITLVTPENKIILYERIIDKLPKPPREVKPHPYGVDLESLKQIISTSKYSTIQDVLKHSFQSIGDLTSRKLLDLAGIKYNTDPRKLSEEDLLKLVEVMKKYDKYKPPKPDALSPFGSEIIIAGLNRMYSPEFVHAVTRKPRAYQGHPFIVEAGIAYGGRVPISAQDKPVVLRYANKIPLLYDEGDDVITAVVKDDIKWSNYLVNLPTNILVLVHVCSTKVPFSGVGKETIADVPEIRREIRLAIMENARRLKKYIARKKKEEEMKKKVINIAKYIPEIARSLAVITHSDGLDKDIITNKLVEILVAKTGLPLVEVKNAIESVEIGV
uniref:Type 2 DNA topoisomerase 6 subunit B n=1 Tax=Staphylothermus marinus TaxID=2280 RepID=A0A7C4D6S5_STAMA